MAENERGQRYITTLFQTLSNEERMQTVEKELTQMKKK
jgi:hypothetical protein